MLPSVNESGSTKQAAEDLDANQKRPADESVAGGGTGKSKLWWIFWGMQIVGLFHVFYPLPFRYRHTVGKFAALPVMPGFLLAWAADQGFRSGSFSQLSLRPLTHFEFWLLPIATVLINCGVFAIFLLIVGRYRRKRNRETRRYSIET